MADEDDFDDFDGFGDFKSAVSFETFFDSSLNNGGAGVSENDGWDNLFQSKDNLNFNGDTVKYEIPNANGFPHNEEHFDHFSKSSSEMQISITPLGGKKGALPLSIFGDLDESDGEEENAGVSPICDQEMNFFVRNYDQQKTSSPLAIQDLVSNLYNSATPQIEGSVISNSIDLMHSTVPVDNPVSNLYSSATPQNEDEDAVISDLDEQNHSPLAAEYIFSNLYSSMTPQIDNTLMVNSEWNGKEIDLNSSGLCSTTAAQSGSEIVYEDDLDDGWEWEYKGAVSRSCDTSLISEGNSELVSAFESEDTYLGLSGSLPLSNGFTDLITASKTSAVKNSTENNNVFESVADDVIVEELVDGSVNFSIAHDNDDKSYHPSPETTCIHEANGWNKALLSEALPLSIFSDEFIGIEIENSSSLPDAIINKPVSHPKSGIGKGSVAIKDIISDLYDQTELTNDMDSRNKLREVGYLTHDLFHSDRDSSTDDCDDGFWEFKDACSLDNIEEQSMVPENSLLNLPPTHKVDPCFDFYAKLKDELSVVVQCHLKNASSCKADHELQLELELPQDVSFKSFSPKTSNINKFFEMLSDPELVWLESEYHLNNRLNQYLKHDPESAIQLMKHSTTMLKIITLGSLEDRRSYLSAWVMILHACLKELKHGVTIWKQALLNDTGNQILSDIRGQKFGLSLCEIYKLVEIVRASTKLYKQWEISAATDFGEVTTLLEECTAVWSACSMPEAMKNSPSDYYTGTIDTLLESINTIHIIDTFSLQIHGFHEAEPVCKLTLLPQGSLPGMRMVVWEGEKYFLQIANFWANLISTDSPRLPSLFS